MLNVFTIHDSAAEAHLRPFFARSKGEAIRSFSDMVNGDSDHPVAGHPGDYTLFQIGAFDELSGKLQSQVPSSLGNGLNFVLSPRLMEEVSDGEAQR